MAVGTNGQVLTAASGQATGLQWADVPASGMTLLSTTTLSGTSTTISSISGSYKNLYIVIQGVYSNAAGSLMIKANGSNIATANTLAQNSVVDSTSTNGIVFGATTVNNQSDRPTTAQVTIYNYANTSYYKSFAGSSGNAISATVASTGTINGGHIQTTSAISSLAITTVVGTLSFSAGQVLIYGVN